MPTKCYKSWDKRGPPEVATLIVTSVMDRFSVALTMYESLCLTFALGG